MRLPSASGILKRAVATPRGWPVRWRLAAVSAMLTLIILVGFAVVVGRLTTNKLESDFRDDLREKASQFAFDIQAARESGSNVLPPGLNSAMSADELVAIVNQAGEGQASQPTPDLGPPDTTSVVTVGQYEVAAAAIPTNEFSPRYFVQYARDHSDLQTTIDRLWLFLAAGVLVGTALAYLAGVAVAVRAMRPISSLTAAAREIASTRDP